MSRAHLGRTIDAKGNRKNNVLRPVAFLLFRLQRDSTRFLTYYRRLIMALRSCIAKRRIRAA